MNSVGGEGPSLSPGSPARPNPYREGEIDVFRLNSPGGRIGLPRLGAVYRLLDRIQEVELLVSRRQSLIVKGTFKRTPSFLHEELSSDRVQGPNVKSYPVITPRSWMDPLLSRLDKLQGILTPGLRFSVSPSAHLRGELRRDDVCLIVGDSGETVRLDTGAWGEPPRELLPPFPSTDLPRALDALEQTLLESSDPPGERSFTSVRRSLLRSFNRSTVSAHEPISIVDSTLLHEDVFARGGRALFGTSEYTVLTRGERDRGGWVLIALEMGVLPLSLLEWMVSELPPRDVGQLRLTPEQNILFRLPDRELEKITPPSGASKVGRSSFSRITTCPGSHFCRLAHPPPVEMARKIHQAVTRHSELRKRWRRTPVGITGCGETEPLERLRPIGITPDPEGGYRLYAGGHQHGEGKAGELIQSGLNTERLLERIPELLAEDLD